jgi:hypothetical protein
MALMDKQLFIFIFFLAVLGFELLGLCLLYHLTHTSGPLFLQLFLR